MSHRKVGIAPHVRSTRVDGDYVLMDLKSGVYLGLDPIGSHIWQSLIEHGEPERAAEELCRDFAVEPHQALTDIRAWIEELRQRGLIVGDEVAPAG
jgi:Coenzyme PQQ synthesis protein D (PqqD)